MGALAAGFLHRGTLQCSAAHNKTTRTPVPCPMAPWPGSSDMLRSFKYIKMHSGPYLSESVCHAMFSYTFMHEFFRQSSDTCAARALLRKKCYVFSHATVRQSQTPGLRVCYYDKSVMLKKNPSSNLFRGPSTISDGIPTQLAGPEPPQKIDDFERDSDPARWAPKPSHNRRFRRGFRPS